MMYVVFWILGWILTSVLSAVLLVFSEGEGKEKDELIASVIFYGLGFWPIFLVALFAFGAAYFVRKLADSLKGKK